MAQPYEVRLFRGSYETRQTEANAWRADLYIDQHCNSKINDREEDRDNYASSLIAHNGSDRSEEIATFYALLAAERFGLENAGCRRVAYGKNGDRCLRYTEMPAFLAEPLFISDASLAAFGWSIDGVDASADCIVQTVRRFCSHGSRIAFSAGHGMCRGPQGDGFDPGAPAVVGGYWEHELGARVVSVAMWRLWAGT